MQHECYLLLIIGGYSYVTFRGDCWQLSGDVSEVLAADEFWVTELDVWEVRRVCRWNLYKVNIFKGTAAATNTTAAAAAAVAAITIVPWTNYYYYYHYYYYLLVYLRI